MRDFIALNAALMEIVWRTDAVVWLSGKKTTRKNLDLALCVYVSKANSKSSTGEAAPMLNTELDYKLLKQAYLLIYSLFLGYTFPSLPATISLFNLSYLASFLSFLNKWNSLKCSRAFRFVFPHGHVWVTVCRKFQGRIFGIIYHFLHWQWMRLTGKRLHGAPWLVKS